MYATRFYPIGHNTRVSARVLVLSSDRIISLARYFEYIVPGELEVQAKRKALAVLQDEITKILNSSRDLSTLTTSLIKGDETNMHQSLDRMKKTEEEVENLCRKITQRRCRHRQPHGKQGGYLKDGLYH